MTMEWHKITAVKCFITLGSGVNYLFFFVTVIMVK
jgi:hypothetical protein